MYKQWGEIFILLSERKWIDTDHYLGSFVEFACEAVKQWTGRITELGLVTVIYLPCV